MVRFSLFLLLTVSLVSLAQDSSESITIQVPIDDSLSNENNNVKNDLKPVCRSDWLNVPGFNEDCVRAEPPNKTAENIKLLSTPPSNIDEEIFSKAREYNINAEYAEKVYQDNVQKIIDSNLTDQKKMEHLQRLHVKNKLIGTAATIESRSPLVKKLAQNGGIISAGKQPTIEDVDGNTVLNPDYGGRSSDFDMSCATAAECLDMKNYVRANGGRIRQGRSSFDVVIPGSSDQDYTMITVNETKGPPLKARISDKETYIHMQKDYTNMSSKSRQAIIAMEHAYKGGPPDNAFALDRGRSNDLAWNDTTKTAYKIMQDAPEFTDDKVIEESIKKHNLKDKNNKQLVSVKEYKKMIADAANKQNSKYVLFYQVNDMNAFLNVKNEFVQDVVTKVQTQKEVFLKNEEDILKRTEQNILNTPKENRTNQQKALQLKIDSQRQDISDLNKTLDLYSDTPKIKQIVNPNTPVSHTDKAKKLIEDIKNLDNNLKERALAKEIQTGQSNVGKGYKAGAVVVGIAGAYELVDAIIKQCKTNPDSSKCTKFLKESGYEMGKELLLDAVARRIPGLSQVKDAWDVGKYVGEKIEKYGGDIEVENCIDIKGKMVCKKIPAREKYIQNPVADAHNYLFNSTENVNNDNNQTIKYIEKCKQYIELLKEKNTTCVKLVQEVHDASILSRDEAKLAFFDKKLEGLGIETTPPDDEKPISIDNYQIPMESVGSSMLTDTTAEVDSIGNKVNLAEELASSEDQKKCETDWDCIDDLDGDLLIENENAWQIKEQLANQANNQAQSQTNQIISQSKEAGMQRAEANRRAQAAFAEGLQELATGLQAIQQQNAAMDADFEAQKQQINIQNSQAISALASQRTLSPTQVSGSSSVLTSSEWAACNNSPYPITDPYACKEFLARGGVPQSYSGQNQKSIPVVKESLKKQGTCNDWLSSGSNEPEQYTVPLPPSYGGSYKFSYEFYDVKDRARVLYNGSVIHDTQCRSDSATIDLKGIRGGQVSIIVDPLCDPSDSNTDWKIKLECPVN